MILKKNLTLALIDEVANNIEKYVMSHKDKIDPYKEAQELAIVKITLASGLVKVKNNKNIKVSTFMHDVIEEAIYVTNNDLDNILISAALLVIAEEDDDLITYVKENNFAISKNIVDAEKTVNEIHAALTRYYLKVCSEAGLENRITKFEQFNAKGRGYNA